MSADDPRTGAESVAGSTAAAPVPRWRWLWLALAAALAVTVAAEAVLVALVAGGGRYETQLRVDASTDGPAAGGASAEPASTPGVAALASTGRVSTALLPDAGLAVASPHARLAAAFPDLAPRGVYLVVDTYLNRLRVYCEGELLREAVCSTGSGTVLEDPVTGRVWVFDTPLGERRVQRKTRDPVWIKPDWAFVEAGYEPPTDFRRRIDDVSLGRYGLYLGDGYIIHGTLFQTLLGRPLTHGCVRLGDEDLEYVYSETPLGARVFLY